MISKSRWFVFLTLLAGAAISAAEASEWQLVEDSSNVRFIGVQEGSAFRGRFQDFTAMIVHDLRSPVTVLGSIGGEIEDAAGKHDDVELKQLAESVRAEVSGMQQMCEQLLEVTRASEQAAQRTREPIDEVVATALASLMSSASNQGIVIEMDLESGVELDVDEAALRRALRNLVTNSLEAMPDGGQLRIDTAREGDEVVVRVVDSGVGIPDDIANTLFEPFVTSAKPGGTGLGLAIVQKAVHDHGGDVEVSKPEGGGTAFALRMPICQPS